MKEEELRGAAVPEPSDTRRGKGKGEVLPRSKAGRVDLLMFLTRLEIHLPNVSLKGMMEEEVDTLRGEIEGLSFTELGERIRLERGRIERIVRNQWRIEFPLIP